MSCPEVRCDPINANDDDNDDVQDVITKMTTGGALQSLLDQ